jgi:hypothetical protein
MLPVMLNPGACEAGRPLGQVERIGSEVVHLTGGPVNADADVLRS